MKHIASALMSGLLHWRRADCKLLRVMASYEVKHVLQALTCNQVGPATAAAALEEMFSSGGSGGKAGSSKRITVVLVDEMDLLVTKRQTVLSLAPAPSTSAQHGFCAAASLPGSLDTPHCPPAPRRLCVCQHIWRQCSLCCRLFCMRWPRRLQHSLLLLIPGW